MDGRISVESAPGTGSKFSFTASFGIVPGVIQANLYALPELTGLRILEVDDNRTSRRIVREIVADRGAKVTEAESGLMALAAIQEAVQRGQPYQIVLLDLQMPGMDGLEFIQHVRQQRIPVEHLIPMLSSDDLSPKLAQIRAAGLVEYVVKPITRKKLFDAITPAIGAESASTPVPVRLPLPARDEPVIRSTVSLLVAEDSPDNRTLITAFFRDLPYAIDFAEDGEIAIQKFMTNRYDLVLMDLQMPGLDGYAATTHIREWERDQNLSPTPIIALTASVFDDAVKRVKEAGCDSHVAKPVRKSILLEVVRQFTQPPPAFGSH